MATLLNKTASRCSSACTTTSRRRVTPLRRAAACAAPLPRNYTNTTNTTAAAKRPSAIAAATATTTAHLPDTDGRASPSVLPSSAASSTASSRTSDEPRGAWGESVIRIAAACAVSFAVALSLGSSPSLANPYLESKKTIVLGVTNDGTIRGCQGNVNPNCVSTASTNELYSPAWRAKTRSAKEAAQELEVLVQAVYPDWSLAQSQTYDFGEYRAFLAPSLFGNDILEFLIKDESVNNRNWEGDREGPFVTYRSLAGSVKYIWPIQQPLSDFGAQKTRLQELREKLGWQVIGCELIECYEY